MKILVTGAGGQLGYDTIHVLKEKGHCVIASDILDSITGTDNCCQYVKADITDKSAVYALINEVVPDAVIHCAAWTAVDAAEEKENEDKVFAVNETATRYIAEACKEIDCKLIYISTDYVFGNNSDTPREADCKDFAPLNIYGKSKLAGEKAVCSTLQKFFIIRISWVFGINGNNFIKTMLNLSKKYTTLRVVNDQVGSPTYTADLAILIAEMIESEKYGYYHATNQGEYISWYEFAKEIFRTANIPMNLIPVTTEEYGVSKAERPKNSRLDKAKLVEAGFSPLPSWQDAVTRYIKELEN